MAAERWDFWWKSPKVGWFYIWLLFKFDSFLGSSRVVRDGGSVLVVFLMVKDGGCCLWARVGGGW